MYIFLIRLLGEREVDELSPCVHASVCDWICASQDELGGARLQVCFHADLRACVWQHVKRVCEWVRQCG